ncbi:S-layer homology domain-containing protein, partial [Bacteroides thetaiotaomicron]
MRNLKRVLSLALASIMLLGMMVVGASAADKTYADLTDSDKITNQEAVSVLVDIGIIEGKTDGSYDPSATVDRATMAKLITMMLMGDVDQASFQGTKTDLTDIDSSWAEGYIKFCYSNGIITGDGKGHFFPTEPVTVVQAAKMLLGAVGYDATDRGYVGDNWSVNIMRDAQSATEWSRTESADGKTVSYSTGSVRSLTKGISVKASDSLTRDNAAQMIFNTLFVT